LTLAPVDRNRALAMGGVTTERRNLYIKLVCRGGRESDTAHLHGISHQFASTGKLVSAKERRRSESRNCQAPSHATSASRGLSAETAFRRIGVAEAFQNRTTQAPNLAQTRYKSGLSSDCGTQPGSATKYPNHSRGRQCLVRISSCIEVPRLPSGSTCPMSETFDR
jgi:hypothetical protein